VECLTSQWNGYAVFASFMILLYPLGIPALFFFLLFKYRHRLKEPGMIILPSRTLKSFSLLEYLDFFPSRTGLKSSFPSQTFAETSPPKVRQKADFASICFGFFSFPKCPKKYCVFVFSLLDFVIIFCPPKLSLFPSWISLVIHIKTEKSGSFRPSNARELF